MNQAERYRYNVAYSAEFSRRAGWPEAIRHEMARSHALSELEVFMLNARRTNRKAVRKAILEWTNFIQETGTDRNAQV